MTNVKKVKIGLTEYPVEDETKVAINQGVFAAGKLLGVGDDGNVTPVPAPSGSEWGSITGTLSNQTDLITALNGKLPISKLTSGTSAPSGSANIGDIYIQYTTE